MHNPFKTMTKLEWVLWIGSMAVVLLSFILTRNTDVFIILAGMVGVAGLIFVAKGHVIAHFISIAFDLLYAFVSFRSRYYGEMLTYLCMNMPLHIVSIVTWLRHPASKEITEVKVQKLKKSTLLLLLPITAGVTVGFFFLLWALGTESLPISTLSIATSFLAVSFMALRSPYYALAYIANDVVLLILWTMAAFRSPEYIAMIVTVATFFVNDLYGYLHWQRMHRRQSLDKPQET